jgi:hypothetical protein
MRVKVRNIESKILIDQIKGFAVIRLGIKKRDFFMGTHNVPAFIPPQKFIVRFAGHAKTSCLYLYVDY